ncbi:uncharacterized protein NEPG_00363 [Nematocida parisii ERTm1]|uniref:uncharacterized protein n=1 Tax=Nematocida parisii (strain ERTm1 / ATCC PRA-289) TaxID=881290 RepID=UPI000264B976|nr:uncharacterized protein NEPG_00363 [Nematocida parisii ERTm1]EIJ94839.1 hypothetical protein NEPG_00363 [Nematocida parisii ERTm1]|eukprot:XP_013058195.1 hypothetical protein NEPG_00363 [Nematocida parisii ERTm1]
MKEYETAEPFIIQSDTYLLHIVALVQHTIKILNKQIELINNLYITHCVISNVSDIITRISLEIESLEVFITTFIPYITDIISTHKQNITVVKQTEDHINQKRAELITNMNILFLEIIKAIELISNSIINNNNNTISNNSTGYNKHSIISNDNSTGYNKHSIISNEELRNLCNVLIEDTFNNLESIQKFYYTEDINVKLSNPVSDKVNKVSIISTLVSGYLKSGVPYIILIIGIIMGIIHVNELLTVRSTIIKIMVEYIIQLPIIIITSTIFITHMVNNNIEYYTHCGIINSIILSSIQIIFTVCTGIQLLIVLSKFMIHYVNNNTYCIMCIYFFISLFIIYTGISYERDVFKYKNTMCKIFYKYLYFMYKYYCTLYTILLTHIFIIQCVNNNNILVYKITKRFINITKYII